MVPLAVKSLICALVVAARVAVSICPPFVIPSVVTERRVKALPVTPIVPFPSLSIFHLLEVIPPSYRISMGILSTVALTVRLNSVPVVVGAFRNLITSPEENPYPPSFTVTEFTNPAFDNVNAKPLPEPTPSKVGATDNTSEVV